MSLLRCEMDSIWWYRIRRIVMKLWKQIAALLCVTVLLAVQSPAQAQQEQDDVCILTTRITPNQDSEVMRRIDELLGVHLKITGVSDSQYDEQLNMLLASGKSPDVFGVGVGNTTSDTLLRAAATITADELKTWMPDVWATIEQRAEAQDIAIERLLERWSVDGELKGFTTGRYNNSLPYGILIRTDILQQLGFDMPQTIADWDALLRAWKKAYPDTYPLTCSNGGADQAFYMFLSAYGVRRDEWILTQNGLEYAPFMPGMRAALEQLRTWYDAGLVDPDYFVLYADSYAPDRLLEEGQTFFRQYYSLENSLTPMPQYGALVSRVIENNPDAVFDWAPFPTLGDGSKPLVANSDLFSGYIVCFGEQLARDRDKLHRVMQAINTLHINQEAYTLQHFGIEGVTYSYTSDNIPTVFDEYNTNAAKEKAGFGWIHVSFLDGCDAFRIAQYPSYFMDNIARLLEDPDGIYSPERVNYLNTPRVNGPLVSAEGVDYGALNETWLKEWDALFTAIVIGLKDISDYDQFVAEWQAAVGSDMVTLANELYLAQWIE